MPCLCSCILLHISTALRLTLSRGTLLLFVLFHSITINMCTLADACSPHLCMILLLLLLQCSNCCCACTSAAGSV